MSIVYNDVRHDAKLAETGSISLCVYSTNVLRNKLKQVDSNLLDTARNSAKAHNLQLDLTQGANYYSQIELNLDDALESAENILDSMIECCTAICAFKKALVTGGIRP